ncbi:hypothetical protein VOLCADRAFT_94235 [Volvox carteri f. nagariensis]|uniref:Uncharacterized protein n=1 Tax=Volvox carteri f. nagariensis TaxID=3068 RepID=D8U4H8_VOLCA|nr:uncharacterized protein VOLCADRAFT_94235 [Volvox carteri f. nagariensis]EFJ45405.1 hypothetical protein VOLCADRAFT_94235 [Volvox carteri f. nagariensis]|eukprot:XP_002953432.1 hypothetical protein VOLCADRAFT_94235 [Volvox carteri f. nagariensis]
MDSGLRPPTAVDQPDTYYEPTERGGAPGNGAAGERLLAADTNTYSYSCSGNSFQYSIQRPYSSSSSSLYMSPWPPTSVGSCGNITLKVSTDDDPFQAGSLTNPRTELRVSNKDYSGSTVRDTSFNISIKAGVVGANLFQIFDTNYGKPCLQLRVSKNSNGISQITYHGANTAGGLTDYGAPMGYRDLRP